MVKVTSRTNFHSMWIKAEFGKEHIKITATPAGVTYSRKVLQVNAKISNDCLFAIRNWLNTRENRKRTYGENFTQLEQILKTTISMKDIIEKLK